MIFMDTMKCLPACHVTKLYVLTKVFVLRNLFIKYLVFKNIAS